jgi:hypothetical protein
VARNDVGEVLLTAWKPLHRCGSLKEAEAEACLFGVRLSVEWIRQTTCVESDCSNLVKALGQEVDQRSRWAGILLEIKEVGNLLPAYYLRHTHREGNHVAHLLAQKALRRENCVVRRFNMPQEVRGQVVAETRAMCPPNCNSNVLI